MTKIYGDWIGATGVDGFRLDTVKHVNMDFWPQFSQGIERGRRQGRQEGLLHVRRGLQRRPGDQSSYVRQGGLPATLDFAFQAAAQRLHRRRRLGARRSPTLYAADDLYTARDTDAGRLPTFLGNHDMGRIGSFIAGWRRPTPASYLRRDQLAHQLMFLTRGQPVVYSGDEQGFTGPGGDKDARQDMFASQVRRLPRRRPDRHRPHPRGRPSTTPAHPLYRTIADARPRCARRNPALTRRCAGHPVRGRRPRRLRRLPDRPRDRTEYVVAVNNADHRADRHRGHLVGRRRLHRHLRRRRRRRHRRRRRQADRHRAAAVGGGATRPTRRSPRPPPRRPSPSPRPAAGRAGRHPGRASPPR